MSLRSLLRVVPVLAMVLLSGPAWAFPEMVRHGYIHCATCHVSVSGGGVLTAYGRSLAREVLSTAGGEEEGSFAWKALNLPEYAAAGGEYRSVYIYRDTPFVRQGNWQFMQADLEAALTFRGVTVDGSAGYQDSDVSPFVSRRHFVSIDLSEWNPSLKGVTVRGGRFLPYFGIQVPDHVASTRRELGWDESRLQGAETYNLEASWTTPALGVFATAILDRPGVDSLSGEHGFAFTPMVALGETSKIGASLMKLSREGGTSRTALGPWATLGFTQHLYLLSELDLQKRSLPGGVDRWGGVNWQRLGYELIQGVHGFVTQEWSRTEFGNDRTVSEAYGVGALWYPRPHFEFQLTWQKRREIAVMPDFYDMAWLMVHFYL
jgi:hypothetical protein